MDLEVWISGTPNEVEIALHGLSQVVTFHYVGPIQKLEAKRIRRYVRGVAAARKAELPAPKGKPKTFTDEPLYLDNQ